jgi:hypothetical protein
MGFNLVSAMHLLWGGLGIYFLLRAEGLSDRSAIFGALAFEFTPKLFAHYGAGHLTLFYAVAWTPWLIWAAQRAKKMGGRWRVVPPVILAIICLADPRWAAYSGILWVIYVTAQNRYWGFQDSANQNDAWLARVMQSLKSFTVNLFQLLPQVSIAVLLACPALLPLLEYTRFSTRSHMVVEDILEFSLPPERLLGLLFPDFGGNHELMVYFGSMVLVLVIVTGLKKGKQPVERFWLWMSLISLVYALGSYIPFAPYLANLPGLRLLRVPSRSLFITGISFAVIAAYSVEAIRKTTIGDSKRRILLVLVALATFSITIAGGIWYITKEFQLNFAYGAVLLSITSLWVGSRVSGRIPERIWYLGLILIALIDWTAVDRSVLSFRSMDDVKQDNGEVASFLAEQDGQFRVYSPSYSLPQHVAMDHRLEMADGVDPLHLESYADYMGKATGVPRDGYHVTIPPFENAVPDRDNKFYTPDPVLLGLLNVRYVVSEFDLLVEGLEFRRQIGETRIYENMQVLPRAWLQQEGDFLNSEIQKVDITNWRPNLIDISASGPGLLVLSEIMYPGWKVVVDGEDEQIQSVAGILRAVFLDEGDHEITFSFQPWSIQLGLILFIVGVLAAMIYSQRDKGNIIS